MRRSGIPGLAGILAALWPAPAPAQTSLTIYSDGRVLERRVFDLAIPAGGSIQRLPAGPLDLSSLFPLDSGVVLTAATYDAARDEAGALRRAVGRTIGFLVRSPTEPARTVEAVVLGVDPERYRLADGTVTFERPGIPTFPADLVGAGPSLALTIESDRARQGLGLGFMSSGASWEASYHLVLGRGTVRVSGRATVQAGTLRADSATVQLLAGQVGRATRKEGPPSPQPRLQAMVAAPAEQQVGEAHLYTLPGRMTLLPGVETSAPLFDPVTAPYERTYTVRGQIPYWGVLPQSGDEAEVPVSISYQVKRAPKTPFGDRPLPGGTARIYQPDSAGRLQLVGEASFDHTAAGQDLRIDAGTAFDLTARRVQTEYGTVREKDRTVAIAGYSVTIANARDSAATVDVLEQRGGEWSVIGSSVPADKLSSTTTRFRVRVPPKGQATLTYRVRVVW